MKNSMTGLELHYLVLELQKLKNARVDKIYQSEKKELLIALHVSGKGKHLLKVVAGKYLYLTEHKDTAQEPTSFCMYLRKKLGNAWLRGIEQVGEERIVCLTFQAAEELKLYVELFGKGNIILCNSSGRILSAEETQRWKDRTVRKDLNYAYPKKEVQFSDVTAKSVLHLAEKSEQSVIKMLAADLGLGGVYAEEVCLIADIDKGKRAAELTRKEAGHIASAVLDIVHRELNSVAVYEDSQIVDATPFPLEYYKNKGMRTVKGKSYSQLLDRIFTGIAAKTKEKAGTRRYEEKIQKIKKIINVQEKRIAELEQEYKTNTKKGNLLYENYQTVDSILKQLRKAWKEKDFEEIREKLKGHRTIKKVKQKGEVVIELE